MSLIKSFRDGIGSIWANLHSYRSPNSGRFQKNEDGHVKGKPYIASSAKGHAKAGVEKKDGVLLRRIVIGLDNPQIIDLSPICNFPVFFYPILSLSIQ